MKCHVYWLRLRRPTGTAACGVRKGRRREHKKIFNTFQLSQENGRQLILPPHAAQSISGLLLKQTVR